MEKAFKNVAHNKLHLWFPNGNGLSTIFGFGSYSDNYDVKTKGNHWETFLHSNTVEIMILNAPDKLNKKIHKKYNAEGEGVIGRLNITQWLEIVNILSKAPNK